MKSREELLEAYNVLVAFQLWRRGAIDGTEPHTPKEIGEAIDTALGVMWGVIHGETGENVLKMRAEVAEQALKSAESANEYLKKELDKTEGYLKISDDAKEAANNLLRAAVIERDNLKTELAKVEAERDQAKKEIVDICTRHNIRYYMDERNMFWEMQDKTYAERNNAAQEDTDADPSL